MENCLIKKCPHCQILVYLPVKDFNCKIYRHGVYKANMQQIDPHLNKEECYRLAKCELIYGCGKPFKVIFKDNAFSLEKCDYI